jgi:hypothetical protein
MGKGEKNRQLPEEIWDAPAAQAAARKRRTWEPALDFDTDSRRIWVVLVVGLERKSQAVCRV